MNNPEFIIFTGPMFGGKTSRMLSLLERARYQNRKIILYKPEKDNRYSVNEVTSHNGITWESKNISKGEDIYQPGNTRESPFHRLFLRTVRGRRLREPFGRLNGRISPRSLRGRGRAKRPAYRRSGRKDPPLP